MKLSTAIAVSVTALLSALPTAPAVADNPNDNLIYVPVTQCRLVNTRTSTGGNLVANVAQDFYAYGDAAQLSAQGGNNVTGCPDPKAPNGPEPAAIAVNLTAVGTQAIANGNIIAYASGTIATGSVVNFTQSGNIANAAIVPICRGTCPDGKQLALLANFANVPAVVDVLGYFYPKTTNVVTVAKDGGDFTSPLDAIAYLKALVTGSDPDAPSATNPWVVQIDPGVYELGNTALNLSEPGITVRGAGQEATILNGDGGGDGDGGSVIISANATRLESLAVTTTTTPSGTNLLHYAIYVNGAPAPSSTEPSPVISRVRAVASDGPIGNAGLLIRDATVEVLRSEIEGRGGDGAFGLSTFAGGFASVTDSVIRGQGGDPTYSRGAVIVNGFELQLSNSTVVADGAAGQVDALYVHTAPSKVVAERSTFISTGVGGSNVAINEVADPTVQIQRSTIRGAQTVGTGAGGIVQMGASQLDGSTPAQAGLTCVASFNGSFGPLNATCQ